MKRPGDLPGRWNKLYKELVICPSSGANVSRCPRAGRSISYFFIKLSIIFL